MVTIYYVTFGLSKPLLTRTKYTKIGNNFKFTYSMLIKFEKSELNTIWKFKFRIFEKNNFSNDGDLYVESFTRIPKTSRPRFYTFIDYIPKKLVDTEPGWEEIYARLEMHDASGTKKDEMVSNNIKITV